MSGRYRVIALVQARMNSNRLPGKVLADIAGHPALWHVLYRLRHVSYIESAVAAIPGGPDDDVLEEFLASQKVDVYRGDQIDVLGRMYNAAAKLEPDHVVRVTGDATLLDPFLLSKVIDVHIQGNYDYTSNCLVPTYPDGLDVECMRFSVLRSVAEQAGEPADREHVTTYIRMRPHLFHCANIRQRHNMSSLCWALDTGEDLAFLRRVCGRLNMGDASNLDYRRVLDLLRNEPEIAAGNKNSRRDWKLLRDIPDIFSHDGNGGIAHYYWEGHA